MSSKLAIELSIALVSDERLIIDSLVGDEHVEDLIAEIIDKEFQPKHQLAESGFPECKFCHKLLREWCSGDECLGK